eukprot:TRINITY_DN569_c0_g1_i1.p1 TRINITY_DN569_c0_g1~~TRINITY_DN569_c0_g1_i1.p1  ORF type:complete len:293 (-),score=44.36 TRINITY_DN569_c0_g1_i1:333-1211(-)
MDPNLKKGILSNGIALLIFGLVAPAMGLSLFAGISIGINWLVFLVHGLPQSSEKFYDATGSLTYFTLICTALALAAERSTPRQLLNPVFVLIWCTRLGSYLYGRITVDGKDSRFDELKQNALRFLGAWTIQAWWCFVVSSPALVVVTSASCSVEATWLDQAGWGIWLLGFAFEVVADRQKDAFRRNSANKGQFITTGLWAYSRHPNYFGEILMWVGLSVSGSSCFQGAQWLAWLSPLTTWVLLMKVSGVPMLEAKGEEKWGTDPAYRWYMEKTPCLVPTLCRPPPYQDKKGS